MPFRVATGTESNRASDRLLLATVQMLSASSCAALRIIYDSANRALSAPTSEPPTIATLKSSGLPPDPTSLLSLRVQGYRSFAICAITELRENSSHCATRNLASYASLEAASSGAAWIGGDPHSKTSRSLGSGHPELNLLAPISQIGLRNC